MIKVVIVIFVQVKYNPLQHHALVAMQTFAQRPIFAKVTIKSQQVLIQCRMNENSTASKKKNFFFSFHPDVLYFVFDMSVFLCTDVRPKHLYQNIKKTVTIQIW